MKTTIPYSTPLVQVVELSPEAGLMNPSNFGDANAPGQDFGGGNSQVLRRLCNMA